MKYLIIAITFLSSCSSGFKSGNYKIHSGDSIIEASSIKINDSENYVDYKTLDGKKGRVNGSFEIYKK